MLSIFLSVYFLSDKLAKHTQKMSLFCFHLLIYLKFVCCNHSTKGDVGVYKVFSSSDLTLLFYRVYFWFILDLRRTKNKHKCAYFKL